MSAVMENGSHVTRAELQAHLTPIRSDVREIKADVKTLLRADAGNRAVARYQRFILTVVTPLVAAVIGTLGALFFS